MIFTDDMIFTKAELQTLLHGMTPEEHEGLDRMLAAHAIAAQRSLAFGKNENSHLGVAITTAKQNDPDASADKLVGDALSVLGV